MILCSILALANENGMSVFYVRNFFRTFFENNVICVAFRCFKTISSNIYRPHDFTVFRCRRNATIRVLLLCFCQTTNMVNPDLILIVEINRMRYYKSTYIYNICYIMYNIIYIYYIYIYMYLCVCKCILTWPKILMTASFLPFFIIFTE